MKSLSKTITIALVLSLVLLAGQAQAQTETRTNTSYTGVQILLPTGDAGDAYDTGWGITGSSRFVMGRTFDLIVEGGYYYLPGTDYTYEGETLEVENMDGLSFLVGGLFDLGAVELGAKGGYYFLDLHEWDLMPMAQVTFGRFSVGGEYKMLGSTNWGAGFVKFRW